MARILTHLPLAASLFLFASTTTLSDQLIPPVDRSTQGSWASLQANMGEKKIQQVTTSVDIGLGHRITLTIKLPAASCDSFEISMTGRGAMIPTAQDLKSDVLLVEFEVDKESIWQTTLHLDTDTREGLQADSGMLSFSGQPLLDALAKGGTLRIKVVLDSRVRKVKVPLEGFREAMKASHSLCAIALRQ
ncbi:MAG: hypothetical protein GY703_04910 [Gammaproteobacteria bacterium]|nr:hypothetical protein [Gammaproteobacteria bacterium]